MPAGDGDDLLEGGDGNDYLFGGTGFDTAIFAGTMSTYSVVTSNGSITIVDNDPASDGDDGTDSIAGIERLKFKYGETASVVSPIILDLAGDGIVTISASSSRAKMDLDGDGKSDKTSWIGSQEAFLFLDRNGDGTFTDASEFSFVDDVENAASDLAGLFAFDSNGDGRLDQHDRKFADFGIWQDANGNGKVEVGETYSLTSAGIASFELGARNVDRTSAFGDVAIINSGTYTLTNGETREYIDAALTYFSAGERPDPQRSRPVAIGDLLGRADVAERHWLDGKFAWQGRMSWSDPFVGEIAQWREPSSQIPAEALTNRKQNQVIPERLRISAEDLELAPADQKYSADLEVEKRVALISQSLAAFGARSAMDWRASARNEEGLTDWYAC